MYRFSILIIAFITFPCYASSQLVQWSDIENFLEEVYSENEVSNAIDIIDHYIKYPIYLRSSNANDLTAIPTIDIHSATIIIRRIRQNPNISYYALMDSLNWTNTQRHIFYVTTSVDSQTVRQSQVQQFDYSIRTQHRIETVRGIEENKYLGDDIDLLQKFKAFYEDFSIAFLANKNSGEVHLAEFYSGSIKYSGDKFNLIVGDYSIKSGFGNVFGNSFSFGKGSELISSAYPYSYDIRENFSTLGLSFLRGVTSKLSFDFSDRLACTVIPFFSSVNRPATIDPEQNIASSLYSSGYFRTPTEILKKDALSEKLFGGAFEIRYDDLSLGGSLVYLDYSKRIVSSSSSVFSGKSGLISSVSVNYFFRRFSFGGEVARDNNGEFGVKLASIYQTLLFSSALHYRNYSAMFRSPFAANFGEFSSPANEEGLYFAVSFQLNKLSKVESYIDVYKSHTRTYTVQMPIRGFDIATKFNSQKTIIGDIYTKIKYEQKTDGIKLTGGSSQTIFDLSRFELRAETEFDLLKNLSLRLRFDAVNVDFEQVQSSEKGFAGYSEIEYKPFSTLRIKARLALFSTDSYSSAIWQFEYRMPSSAGANALFESGNRAYISIDYKPIDAISFYLTFTRYQKYNTKTLGSSYELIKSNTDNRIYSMIAIQL